MFLVYVNDITDEDLGLSRVFADDTSIGHIAHNVDKTDIMVFSTCIRNCDFKSNFNYNNIQIDPVASDRHLGVYFR